MCVGSYLYFAYRLFPSFLYHRNSFPLPFIFSICLSIYLFIYLSISFLSTQFFFLAQCLTFYLNQNKQALFLFLLNTSFLLFAFTFQTKRSKGATSFSHSGLRFSQIFKRSRVKIWFLANRTPLQFLGTSCF